MNEDKYRIVPIPRQRRFALDAGRLGRGKHIVHGLAEVDVTVARKIIEDHEEKTGQRLSFTAFVINCLGEAINRHRELHAYRDWRGQLVIFEKVNVATMVEVEMDGRLVPMPYVFKGVDGKSFQEIHEEMRRVQSTPKQSEGGKIMGWFLYLPWIIRRPVYWIIMRMPQLFRRYSTSVLVTAVGMFSRGASWGIPRPSFTLTVTLGSIAEKPGVVDGEIAVREFLHLTVSVDHDVVDGAPIARFGNDFMALLEGAYGLSDQD
jgi:pyruvate/2-oxoglutarate dehydrogenase complex dihydrolipoamide acyltransferase (E2) component